MCGLFGHVVKVAGSIEVANPGVMSELAKANLKRGSLGYGMWAWTPQRETLVREGSMALQPFQTRPLAAFDVSAVHVRAPTGGQDALVSKVHPFRTDRFLFAHNGVLVNWKHNEQQERWRHVASSGIMSYIDVDSVSILAGIQAHVEGSPPFDVPSAIAATMEHIEGQAACWLWDDLFNQLYIWRVMSTLYIYETPYVRYFSSARVDTQLKGFDAREEVVVEGMVYHMLGFQKSNAFRFSSPYTA